MLWPYKQHIFSGPEPSAMGRNSAAQAPVVIDLAVPDWTVQGLYLLVAGVDAEVFEGGF